MILSVACRPGGPNGSAVQLFSCSAVAGVNQAVRINFARRSIRESLRGQVKVVQARAFPCCGRGCGLVCVAVGGHDVSKFLVDCRAEEEAARHEWGISIWNPHRQRRTRVRR